MTTKDAVLRTLESQPETNAEMMAWIVCNVNGLAEIEEEPIEIDGSLPAGELPTITKLTLTTPWGPKAVYQVSNGCGNVRNCRLFWTQEEAEEAVLGASEALGGDGAEEPGREIIERCMEATLAEFRKCDHSPSAADAASGFIANLAAGFSGKKAQKTFYLDVARRLKTRAGC